ncbi:hypothetical protein Bca101_051664 [Brassica carinata]
MNSNSKNSISGDLPSKKPNGKDVVSSAAPVKSSDSPTRPSVPPTKSSAAPVKPSAVPVNPSVSPTKPSVLPMNSSATSMKPSAASMKPSAALMPHTVVHMGSAGQSGVSGYTSTKKRNDKAVFGSDVSSDKNDGVVMFNNVTFGPQEAELRFRLIHFWEARNAITKTLIGLEMLLIDEEGTVIHGFIPPSRIDTYLRHMIPGSTYRLNNYFGSKTKKVYRVADPDVTIAFSWNSVLSVLTDSSVRFPEDRFRFHGYEEFEAACDLKGDLFDYIGHIRLVNEQTLTEDLVLDENEIASMRRILIHVQTYDGPVMKLYLWDKAATDLCENFKSLRKPPSVILVTAVNPKRFGGSFELNSEAANRVNAEIVTKAETATIGDLLSYMKQEDAKVAWFECTATIDDVMRDSAWYYIACGGCKTKATKGPTTLMCKKCGKTEITGSAEYLTKISVYDNNDYASFVVLGDAGQELTGKKASGLVESYYEAYEGALDGHVVPVPQALIDVIGQTRTFVIKISKHNLKGKTQSLTVTKVLPHDGSALGSDIGADVVVSPDEVALGSGNSKEGSSIAKRTKCG